MLQTAISSGNVNNGMIAFRMRPDPAAPTNDMDPALLKRVIQPPTLRSQPSGNEIQIEAHLFGRFSVSVNGVSVAPCSSSAGWSTLAYLLAQQRTSVPVDVLEGIFWPDASTHAARNNRNVALSHLRQALRLVSAHNIIEHHGGKYVFAQGCSLWTDAQDFEQCLANGRWLEANHRNEEAVARYKAALSLYQDDFLVDEL